jgi:hypothetical protein
MLAIRLLLLIASGLISVPAAESPLNGDAANLYRQAQDSGRFFADAARLKPEIRATSDGKSYVLIWKGSASPKRWIASLHGAGRPARGFATDDLVVWHPHIKDRSVGLVCLQWWLGAGDGLRDFYTPDQIYRELDRLLESLGAKNGDVMLHGFSRGSANSYTVAALDAGRGKKYFSPLATSATGAATQSSSLIFKFRYQTGAWALP